MTRLPNGPRRLDSETAASRASAYVYGNVLVLAALIALHPDDLSTIKGVLYVAGVAFSTFVAHLLGESVGERIRGHRHFTSADIRSAVRNALPIASAATTPTLLLIASWNGWITHLTALVVAEIVTVGRLAFLGSVIERLSGEKSSARIIVAGIALGLTCTAVAGLKLLLTH